MRSCNHTKIVDRAVVEMDWDMGEEVSRIVSETVETFKDIDTHRYQCTQCNEVFYYSGAAKDFYEKGVKSGVFLS